MDNLRLLSRGHVNKKAPTHAFVDAFKHVEVVGFAVPASLGCDTLDALGIVGQLGRARGLAILLDARELALGVRHNN